METSKLAELPETTQGWLVDRWNRFREESPYFQAKAGLVFLYGCVVVLTVLLAPPKIEPWICEERVIDFGLNFKTALEITNVDNGDLVDVVVEVHGKSVEFDGKRVPGVWASKPRDLPEGEKVRMLVDELRDARGGSAPASVETERIVIRHGTETVAELVPSRPASAP